MLYLLEMVKGTLGLVSALLALLLLEVRISQLDGSRIVESQLARAQLNDPLHALDLKIYVYHRRKPNC